MTDKDSISVLQRKLASAGGETAGTGRSILRALRLAVARAAADVFDLALSAIGATQAWRGQDDLGRHLDDTRLLVLLDGPEGATGALSLDRTALGALIQQQTTGKVLDTPSGTRPYTGTDAALTAPLIDAMLTGAHELCDRPEDRDCLAGYRFGARAGDSRSLLLALEGESFRVFDLTLDIAGGQIQGAMTLILPEPAQPAGAGEPGAGEPGLEAVFGTVRAELMASIGHVQLPLSELGQMKPGDILPLQGRNLRGVELWTIAGERVARGRLGQIRGLRAVRLNDGSASDADGFADRALAQDRSRTNAAREMENRPPQTMKEDAGPGLASGADSESDAFPDNLTPDQAAAAISQLAGLPPEDSARPQAEE